MGVTLGGVGGVSADFNGLIRMRKTTRLDFELLEPKDLLTTPPTTLSATPGNATVAAGQAVQISGTFADANGADDLRLLEIRISDGESQQPRCFLRYDVDTDFIRLWDDQVGGFRDVGRAGQNNAGSNDNCEINTATTFVTDIDGTSKRLTSEIVFTSAIAGDRNIWLRAYDYSNRWSDRVDHGDILITDGGGTTPPPTTPPPTTPPPTTPPPPPTTTATSPTTLSATPGNATVAAGQAVQISGTFADANGADDLRLLEIRISDGESQQPRCFLRYDVDTDFIRLWDDQVGGFRDVGRAGQNNAGSNDNCEINTATTFVTDIDGTSKRLTSEIVFTSAIAGERNIWLRAYDYSNRWSDRVDHGDILITDGGGTTPPPTTPPPTTPPPTTPPPTTPPPTTPPPTTPPPPPTTTATSPTTLSATPGNATVAAGQAVQISGTFADANGADDLRLLEIRISDGESQQPRCFLRYDVDTDFIRLWDDEVGGFRDVGRAGQNNAGSNDNCEINTATTFVTDIDGTSKRLTSEIVFTSAIAGDRNIWLRAYDYSNRWSDRVDHGDILITDGGGTTPPPTTPPPTTPPPSTSPQAPVTVSVSPADSTVAAGEAFQVMSTFADANGTDDFRLLEVRISEGTSTQPRCFLRYDLPSNQLKLWNDAISGFESIGAPGSNGVQENAYCSVRAADVSTRNLNATTVEMTTTMTMQNSMSGAHNVWLRAMDDGGQWSERTDHGDVYVRVNAPTLPPAPPPPPTTNPGDPNVPTPSGGGPSNSGTRASISDGYTDQQSYDQYSLQRVYINANSTRNNARIDLYDESARVVDSVFFDARPQQPRNANPVADGFGYDASFTYNVAGLPSGVYWWNNSIPFVVKDTNRTSKIRVVLATNTMAAYTCSGGRNMYGCGSYSEDKVSFNRQFQSVRHGLPDGSNIRRETGGVSNPFFWWLEQEIGNLGTTYGVIADRDLEDPSSLQGADVVVLVGHSEYWTRNARLVIDQFVDNGGNMAVFSGNTMWWQSRYEGDQLVVYKRASEDPVSNPLLETINWNHPSLEYPIFHSIGADFKHGGYIEMDPPNNAPGSFNGYKITQANSPILEGVNVSNGDIIRWDSDYIFSEYDGAPISGFDGNGYPIIDNNVLGFHKVEMIGYDHAYRSVPGFGMLMAFQRTPSSGYVINTNTMQWPYEMTKSPDRDDLQRISFNILDKLLNDEEIFSPSVARSPTAAEFEELSFVPGTLSQSESTDNSETDAVDRVITDVLAGELEQSAGRQNVQPSWLELYRPSERDLGTLLFERLSEDDDDVEEHGKLASLF